MILFFSCGFGGTRHFCTTLYNIPQTKNLFWFLDAKPHFRRRLPSEWHGLWSLWQIAGALFGASLWAVSDSPCQWQGVGTSRKYRKWCLGATIHNYPTMAYRMPLIQQSKFWCHRNLLNISIYFHGIQHVHPAGKLSSIFWGDRRIVRPFPVIDWLWLWKVFTHHAEFWVQLWCLKYLNLVGGLEHFLFFHILGIIIPIDYYFSEGLKPPTRNIFKVFHN